MSPKGVTSAGVGDKAQGDDEFITNLDSEGFNICLKNFDQPITKTINFVAQGY